MQASNGATVRKGRGSDQVEMTRHVNSLKELAVTESEYRKRLEDTQSKFGFISTDIYRKALNMWEAGCRFWPNVQTTVGRDRIHALGYTLTSLSGNAGFNNVALSSDTGGASAAHTALAGEITTNGLQRATAGTITHTNGTNSTLIDHTFTASGSFTAIVLCALFNINTAPVSGTMGHEGTISSTDLASGDGIRIQYTVNNG